MISRISTVRVQATAQKPSQRVAVAVPRRELLAAGATIAALLGSAAAAQAAAESSATKAITAVNRPTQLKQKNENREALREQVRKVREGEADPKSLP